MSKIYQKMYLKGKNPAEGVLSGFIDNVILRGFYSESCPLSIKRAGFTLIELLVVVLVVGILAAVALPQYEKAVKKSRAAGLLPIIKDIQQAQTVYYLSNGKYASCLNDLDFDVSSFSVKAESDGCVSSYEKGSGTDKITLQRVGNGGIAAYSGNYGASGFGGYGFNPDAHIGLSCAEYACHMVEEGSFCHDILGTKKQADSDTWCMRLFALP